MKRRGRQECLRHILIYILLATTCLAQNPPTPAQAKPQEVPAQAVPGLRPTVPPPGSPPQQPIPQTTTPQTTPPIVSTQPQTPPATPAPTPQALPASATAPGGLNLTNASLLEVIDLLARDLKINYILDPRVKGSVTINTYGEVKALDLKPLLETILRMNGFAMVQVGNMYRIVPVGDVSHLPVPPQRNATEFTDDERMVLNLVFLKFMTSAEMFKLLEPFLGESAKMVAYDPANLLIIQDNSRNMRRSIDLISIFDNDTFAGQRVRLFNVTNGRPTDLVKELETVFKAYALSEKSAAVRFLPIDRISTLIAVAPNPGVFTEVEKWLKKLDIPVKTTAGSVDNHVYRLRYGRAEIVGAVIGQLYGTSYGGGMGMYGGMYSSGMGSGGMGYPQGGGMGYPQGGGMGYPQSGMGYPQGGGMNGMNGAFMGGAMMGGPMAGPTAQAGAQLSNGTAAGASGLAGGVAGNQDLTGSYLGYGSGMGANYLPRIIPNPFDNTLLIQATPQQWEQISRLLEQLDIPPRQVLIDARIYEVDLTGAFASGVEAYLAKRNSATTGSKGEPLSRQLLGGFSSGATMLTAGMLVGQSRELLGLLTAQESNTKARVISAPSVIATDSIQASINVGTDVPTLSSQAVAGGLQQGGNSLFTNTIQNRSTGVSLNILARVNSSGVVTMVINQDVSAPVANTSSTIDSPSFSKRNVTTQVTVEDGDTIAIGGIIQETATEGTSGIPLLHRIPVVGAAFGSRNYTKQRTELIIFLTPRVIYDTNQVAEATEELKAKVRRLSKMIKE